MKRLVETPYVLVVQHVAPETPGLIAVPLLARGFEVRLVRPYAGDQVPTELGGAAGLVVMGGPMGVHEGEQFPHLLDEMRLLERALRVSCPILAICLGSQLLAHVLGAEVVRGRQKEIGWHPVTLAEGALLDPLFKTVESSFCAFHWHGEVFNLALGATSLLRSQLTEHQAFRFGPSAYGLLCHLEVTPEILEAMVQAFPEDLAEVGVTPEDLRAGAQAHLSSLGDRAQRIFGGWTDLVADQADSPGQRSTGPQKN